MLLIQYLHLTSLMTQTSASTPLCCCFYPFGHHSRAFTHRFAQGPASNANAAPTRLAHKIQPQKSFESMEKAPTSVRRAQELWRDVVLCTLIPFQTILFVDDHLYHGECTYTIKIVNCLKSAVYAIGHYTPHNNMSSCGICDVGRYAAARSYRCTLCRVGFVTPKKATVSCSACPAGRVAPDKGTVNCTDCRTGNEPFQIRLT